MIYVTKTVVPSMLNTYKQTKGRSLVLNIGSFSSNGGPLLGVYAASKGENEVETDGIGERK